MVTITSLIRNYIFMCFVFIFATCDDFKYTVSTEELKELQYLNLSVDPCDDFYAYTCGNFKNIHPLPADQQLWDHFSILQKEIHQLLQVILESEREDDDPKALQKAKVAYKACTSVDYTDLLDLSEKRVISDLGGWPAISDGQYTFSWAELGDVVAQFGINMFFTYSIIPNLFNATENVIYFSADSVSSPSLIRPMTEINYDNFDYLDSDETPLPLEVYLNKVANKLKTELGSFKSSEKIAEDIAETIEFMKTVTAGGIVEVNTTITTLASVTTVGSLQNWTDNHFNKEQLQLDWVEYLNHVFGLAGVRINSNTKILQASLTTRIYGLLNLIQKTDAALLKNFVISRILTHTAPDSEKYMRDAFEAFYKEEQLSYYPRDEYCLRKILDYPNNVGLSLALTYEYQRYHFNVNLLQGAAEMVTDLQDAFQEVLNSSDWMDEVTKEKALYKAQQMVTLLGYPEFAEDAELLDKYYENLRVCGWDHFSNSQRLRAFRLALNFAEIGKLRDRALWTVSPLYTNAFYNAQNNRMLFPVAMLNPIFYNGDLTVLDYGRIGAIIGHEITHGFDNSGRTRDAEGTTTDWWSDETKQAYSEKIQCFIDQYSKFYVDEIESYVNGTTSVNENLADNGGLKDAYKAFQKLQRRRSPLKTVSNYTLEQLFFIGFGTMWCSAETDAYLSSLVNSAYAPARFRVNGAVSNMEEFAEAFGCPIGSKMNPENKCMLW